AWPQQTAKPRPEREINRHVKLEDKPTKNGDRRQPGECDPEERHAGDVTEEQISEPPMAGVCAGKPNGGDKGSQRDPTEPRQVERRKASRVKQPATDRSQPRPKFCDSYHRSAFRYQTRNIKSPSSNSQENF